ncbi:hypothetical protein GZ989_003860 [Campylobacter fetus]|uniref:hypothetical protein n=1 Tax=Campylobacter fetus TaxID=196 RepID=UPI0001BCCF87|nr:hypothetical protein [Campylobacter fetus]OCS21887.1 hypothetical protein CFVI97532_07190 [Campylobacter fetus subsp. venerealis cfvi97/532]OCS43093.1 hypothetical protein CFVI02298_01215 [Campylobacter fetus subsp. venerealis cfvi02/298]AHE94382.1 hypothetical protein CFVI03293_1077 [Campylobacter fetus subsp. venerealis cfvi03/293]EAI3887235.1 hypothetical protein [Campylobacter fetus]KAA3684573.1 hypothetical protein E3U40_06280 [Campylobacter fetus subsp. venerealis]
MSDVKQSKSLSNLALILNDLDEMIEDLSDAISVDDTEEIYENAKAIVEYYQKTKKKLNLD